MLQYMQYYINEPYTAAAAPYFLAKARRKTKRKRNYYICENNPKSCDYISWNKPKPGEKWNPEEAEEVKKETKKTTKKTTKSKKTKKK